MLKDQANDQLDAKGLRCPEPLMLVRNKIRTMAAAQVLYIEATDPTTERDLVNFCRFMGHDMLSQGTQGVGAEQVFEFWIKKA
jgi:tRNA 2-thiouridine synthesizing protein A